MVLRKLVLVETFHVPLEVCEQPSNLTKGRKTSIQPPIINYFRRRVVVTNHLLCVNGQSKTVSNLFMSQVSNECGQSRTKNCLPQQEMVKKMKWKSSLAKFSSAPKTTNVFLQFPTISHNSDTMSNWNSGLKSMGKRAAFHKFSCSTS